MTALFVALGASLGAPARFLLSRAVPGRRSTLAANLAGSALLGVASRGGPHVVALVGTGFCGAFTTFSAFALETVEADRRARAGYVLASLLGCLGAVAVGRWSLS